MPLVLLINSDYSTVRVKTISVCDCRHTEAVSEPVFRPARSSVLRLFRHPHQLFLRAEKESDRAIMNCFLTLMVQMNGPTIARVIKLPLEVPKMPTTA